MDDNACEALQSGVLPSLTWQKGVVALGAMLAFFLAAKLGGHLLRRGFSKRGKAGGVAFALSKLLAYFLTLTGILTALGLFGFPVGSLLLTSSAALIGLGFALRHVGRDFVSGVVILIEQSIRKNDFITFANTKGTVLEIGLRSTRLLTRDGTTLVVPNHRLTSTELSNHSSPHKRARFNVKLAIGFRENVDLVKETLLSIAEDHSEVLPEPPPMVRFEAILDSHFQFVLIVWVEEPVTTLRVASELRFAIARTFARRGIEFPTAELELLTRPPNGESRLPPQARPEEGGAARS